MVYNIGGRVVHWVLKSVNSSVIARACKSCYDLYLVTRNVTIVLNL